MGMTWMWWWNVQDRTVVGTGSEVSGPGAEFLRKPYPPDRLPPRRGGRSSPYTYVASAADRVSGRIHAALAGSGAAHEEGTSHAQR